MPRERKDFKRTSGLRDARLFVIATEGEKTESKYFTKLTSEYFPSSKVHVEIIPSKDGKSAPKYVLEGLDSFRREYRIKEDDELWIIIDRDFRSWTTKQISETIQVCKQKGYFLSISNPCFEFWIILHILDINDLSSNLREEIKINAKKGNRTKCENLIIDSIGSYNKKDPDFNPIIPNILTAIEQAKSITKNNSIDLFKEIGSNVYVLVEKII